MTVIGIRSTGVISGAALLAGGAGFAAPAQAVPPPRAVPSVTSTVAVDQAALAGRLSDRLGARSAGGYLDRSGRAVVTVTSADDAATVRAAGATPRAVARSGADLAKATGMLSGTVKMTGTGWAVDPAAGQVVLWADSTVQGSRMSRLKAVAGRLGSSVRIERVPGRLSTRVAGGDVIFGGGARCTAGFNVRSGGTYYLLTAGHCTRVATTWTTADGTVIGTTSGSSFPGNDFGFIRYINGGLAEGTVNLYNGSSRDITRAANPVVGQAVQRSGPVTGLRSGTVTALNATVNYAEGTVSGLIRTTMCADPGDSGGPLFGGSTAHGILSGGSGTCSSGGATFFQPVVEALNAYGMQVF